MTLPTHLEALLDDLRPAAARAAARDRQRTVALVVVVTVLAFSLVGGVAVAAVTLLGAPAPERVQSDLHAGVRGFVNRPELQSQTARVVAESRDATLYGVSDKRGSYCVELVGARRGLLFASSCNTTRATARAGELAGECCGTVQYVVTDDGIEPPVVQFGRLPEGAVKVRAVLGSGKVVPIPVGLDGFYVYEPSPSDQANARREAMSIEALDASGHPMLAKYLQPPQPLRTEGAMGRYDGLPRQISGTVVINGAAKIKVQLGPYNNSKTTAAYVGLRKDGSFDWTVPEGGQYDVLTVLDSRNRPLTDEIFPLSEPDWRGILAQAKAQP